MKAYLGVPCHYVRCTASLPWQVVTGSRASHRSYVLATLLPMQYDAMQRMVEKVDCARLISTQNTPTHMYWIIISSQSGNKQMQRRLIDEQVMVQTYALKTQQMNLLPYRDIPGNIKHHFLVWLYTETTAWLNLQGSNRFSEDCIDEQTGDKQMLRKWRGWTSREQADVEKTAGND